MMNEEKKENFLAELRELAEEILGDYLEMKGSEEEPDFTTVPEGLE